MATQLWMVTLTTETKGPRGGKAKPLIDKYVVAAETRDEARAAFASDMPGYIEAANHVSVAELGCCTWRAA